MYMSAHVCIYGRSGHQGPLEVAVLLTPESSLQFLVFLFLKQFMGSQPRILLPQPLVPDLRVCAAVPDSELCSKKEKVWCVF